MESLFQSFCGPHREWTLFAPPSRFVRPFSANSFETIERRKCSLFGPNPVEYHFSVELYSCVGSSRLDLTDRIGWTLVFDFDCGLSYEGIQEEADKYAAMQAVSEVLDKFHVLFFTDSRYHIWIPDWETMLVPNWNKLFGSVFVTRMHQYLVFVSNLPEGIYIDANLWKTARHKIRMPYSIHLKSGERQVLMLDGKEIPEELASFYWSGEFLTKQEKKEYMESFHIYVQVADKLGQEIIDATTKKEHLDQIPSSKYCKWIEDLLKKPVPIGFRGLTLWLIIMPYLVNVRRLPLEEVVEQVHKWLDISHGDRTRDYDLYSYPKSRYAWFKSKSILPISLRKLMLKYPELYRALREV